MMPQTEWYPRAVGPPEEQQLAHAYSQGGPFAFAPAQAFAFAYPTSLGMSLPAEAEAGPAPVRTVLKRCRSIEDEIPPKSPQPANHAIDILAEAAIAVKRLKTGDNEGDEGEEQISDDGREQHPHESQGNSVGDGPVGEAHNSLAPGGETPGTAVDGTLPTGKSLGLSGMTQYIKAAMTGQQAVRAEQENSLMQQQQHQQQPPPHQQQAPLTANSGQAAPAGFEMAHPGLYPSMGSMEPCGMQQVPHASGLPSLSPNLTLSKAGGCLEGLPSPCVEPTNTRHTFLTSPDALVWQAMMANAMAMQMFQGYVAQHQAQQNALRAHQEMAMVNHARPVVPEAIRPLNGYAYTYVPPPRT